jgi:1-acyl-sn-glycerol-3-phosphate acyltransferase
MTKYFSLSSGRTPSAPSTPQATFCTRLGRSLLGIFRLTRLTLHLVSGLITVACVYPFISHSTQLALKQRWSLQLLCLLGLELKVGAGETAMNVEKVHEIPLKNTKNNPQQQSTASAYHSPLASSYRGMLVANHISFLDVFVINAWLPTAFVAKNEIRHWPVLGWLSNKTDTIFLQRGSRRAAHAASDEILQYLGENRIVAFFPEGTTSTGDTVLPFHSALFQSAIDAACPVTPVALQYLDAISGQPSHAADFIGEDSLLACLWSIVTSPKLIARLEPLVALNTAIENTDKMDRRHLAAHAHRTIAHHLLSQAR